MFDKAERPSTRRLYLALSLALLLFVGVGLNSLSPAIKLGSSMLLAAVLIMWFTVRGVPLPRKDLRLALPLALLVVYQGLSLFWSPLPRPSTELWLQNLLLLAFFMLVLAGRTGDWPGRAWLDGLLLIVAALCLLELLLVAEWLLQWRSVAGEYSLLPPVGYRASGLILGHPNVLSGLINLAIPLAIYLFVRQQGRPHRLGVGAFIVLLLATQYFTSSRTGWISLVASLVVMASLMLLSDRQRSSSLLGLAQRAVPSWSLGRWMATALGAAALAYAAFWQIGRTGHAPLERARLSVWEGAIDLVQQAPIWGSGLGAFPPLFSALPSSHPEESIPHAHNLLLQVSIDSGLPGLILTAAFILTIANRAYRTWQTGSQEVRRQVAAFTAIVTAVLFHHIADFLFGPPLYTMACAVVIGLLPAREQPHENRQPRFATRALVLAAVVGSVLSLGLLQSGNWTYWSGATGARSGDWGPAERLLCNSYQVSPSEAAYANACGLARSLNAEGGNTGASGLDAFLAAAKYDPNWYVHAANAGVSARTEGRYEQSRTSLDQAIRRSPITAELYLNRGYSEELDGRPARAAAYYRLAAMLDPWVIHSAFINANSSRMKAIAGMRPDRHVPSNQILLWWAYEALHSGHLDLADRLLERNLAAHPRSSRAYALRAYYSLLADDIETAEQYASVATFVRPNDPWVHLVWIELYDRTGAPQLARRRILQAAADFVNHTDSERYYFAAHGRYSLPIDSHPAYIRSVPADLAKHVLELMQQPALSQDDQYTLARFLDHAGVAAE